MPDDFGSSITSRGTVTAPGSVTGSIEVNGDHDWFAVALIAGRSYRFDLEGAATSAGTNPDPWLNLRSTSGQLIASDDDAGVGYNSLLFYTPQASGTYFLDVQGYAESRTGSYTLRVTDTGAVRAVSINDTTVSEGGGNAVFTVSLSGTSQTAVTVSYTTINGTALSGADFIARSNSVTIPAGQTSATVSVALVNDIATEGSETFSLMLTSAAGASLADAVGVATIIDNDTQRSIVVGDVSVNEGAGSAVFTISLSGTASTPVVVGYSTTNGTALAGTDYQARSGSVTIAAGSTSATVAVSLVNDTVMEGTESFGLALLSASGATISDSVGVATVADNDERTLSVNDVFVSEGTASATFTVSLNATNSVPVTFGYQTLAGTAIGGLDFSHRSATGTIATGQRSTTVTVPIVNDTFAELSETFVLSLFGPSGASIADGTGVGTILDNEPRSLSISDASVAENAGLATFAVTLSAPSSTPVTVRYSTANGTAVAGADFGAASSTLTLAPGATLATVSIPIFDDALKETTEQFSITLSSGTGAILGDSVGVATIADNEPVRSISVNDVSVSEGAGTAVFTVSLSGATSTATSFSFATANGTAIAGSDYTARSGTASIAAGQTSTTVSISLRSDTLEEFTESFRLQLTAANGAVISDSTGIATIQDNDARVLSVSDVAVAEGGTRATFTVSLNAPSVNPVSFTYATQNGTATAGVDYDPWVSLLGLPAVIPVGQTRLQISVPLINDSAVEGTETFSLQIANASGAVIGDGIGVAAVANDDVPTIRIESRPVALHYDHLYLVYSDALGGEYVIRGDSEFPAGGGTLVTETGELRTSEDGRAGDSIEERGSRILDLGGRNPADVWNLMLQQAASIDLANLDYRAFHENSNSIINSVLDAVGIKVRDYIPSNTSVAELPAVDNVMSVNSSLTGNASADVIRGNGGADVLSGVGGNDSLNGGAGNDVLDGGTGRDSFIFNDPFGPSNVDRIIGFVPLDDSILLENAIFTALGAAGTLASAAFWSAAGASAGHDTSDRIVYNVATGELFYDADGTGPIASTRFAIVNANLAITNADFIVT